MALKIDKDQLKALWEQIKGKKWYVILSVVALYLILQYVVKVDLPLDVVKIIVGLF